MKILGIETSCDETGVCIIETKESGKGQILTVLGNQLYSQVAKHAEFGGVVPMMAKREHSKNLVPLFKKCLEEAGEKHNLSPALPLTNGRGKKNLLPSLDKEGLREVEKILEREPELFVELQKLLETIEKPKIDAIAVTNGPGLEPALWVGVTFAKALGIAWNIPITPTNHMEGHIVVSSLIPTSDEEGCRVSEAGRLKNQKRICYIIKKTKYPAIALLISGGHTQLVLIKENLQYKIIGGTRDDAVGEAYDKVARMLGLPYPGGPQISKYADEWKNSSTSSPQEKGQTFKFPRPMIHSKDLDFSFSGLKTSVLYTLKEIKNVTKEIKQEIAFEFQNAIIDVLVAKTREAIIVNSAETLIVGGGVIANKDIRIALEDLTKELGVNFQLPEISASTDNALMIAIAGFMNILADKKSSTDFKANGNLSL